MSWHSWRGRTLVLHLRVQPGARRSEFSGLHDAALKIRIRAQPIDGQANAALIDFLAAEFSVSKATVRLLRGGHGRSKIIEVDRPGVIPVCLHTLGLREPSGNSLK